MQTPFEEIVRAWLLDYDDRVPSERRDRREAFIILLGNLSDHGYNKSDINSARKEKIVRSCVNPYHNNKSKLKKWISVVVNDLDAAILVYYGTITIRRNVLTAEMADKLDGMQKKADEVRALKTSDSDQEDDSDCEETSLNLSNEDPIDLGPAKKPSTEGKVVEITKDMLDEMKGPEVSWDEDLENRLGIKFDG